jgi:hypothetical protein
MINEIEAITKSLPTKKIPEPDRFTAQFYKTSNKEQTPMLLRCFTFYFTERDKTLSNSFYEDVLP